MVLTTLLSCKKTEIDPDVNPGEGPYFIKFNLKEPDGKAREIYIPKESLQSLSGNGVKDSEFVAVGFGFSGAFISPADKEITQDLSFYISFSIPETEFYHKSGSYEFKEPKNLKNYIPLGNLFHEGPHSISTFFHEDIMTFCSAPIDASHSNIFRITKMEYCIDTNGVDALDIEGRFTTKYNLVCNDGDVLIGNGSFRVKLLIDEIP